MVGGYMKDLTKPENCQNGGQVHAQEWAVACIYFYSSIQRKIILIECKIWLLLD